ncbi:PilZ domain-containing protein [Gilvimarinus xylanilyticus]|uniref:PilZ domain-containing protein n=1 Tax=Gilvimarinus xylanilyticus TaxID=2944139 RepID=A0A9X2HXJ6_9GAMM|nr:PilZ domain-containing protein [Gilvimarinus xylanilyticus]MCP8899494.1 PilZ domain-containing protein [Gilvimarinus xylanilyticus]
MNPSLSEQRQEYRLNASEAVYIELEAESDEQPGSILLSRSTDLSANGLQVEMDRALPTGHIYALCVQLREPDQRFVLSGEVKWCRAEHGRYSIGIALYESDDTSIEAWKQAIAHRLHDS